MYINTQFKIKNNPKYIEFLHTNSYWYKKLNRTTKNFNDFENDFKNKMSLNLQNKINEVVESLDLISTFISKMQ